MGAPYEPRVRAEGMGPLENSRCRALVLRVVVVVVVVERDLHPLGTMPRRTQGPREMEGRWKMRLLLCKDG